MIQVIVNSTTKRQSVIREVTSTPYDVFNELDIDTCSAMITMNGRIISMEDMRKTFGEMDVEDESAVKLNAIIKADGA